MSAILEFPKPPRSKGPSPLMGKGIDLTDPKLPPHAKARRRLRGWSMSRGEPIVLAREARWMLRKMIADNNYHDSGDGVLVGGLRRVAEASAMRMGVSAEVMVRRIYSVLNEGQPAVRASWLEAVIFANDYYPQLQPRELCACMPTAVERIKCEAEESGKSLTPLEIRRKAKQMVEANRRLLAREMAKDGRL